MLPSGKSRIIAAGVYNSPAASHASGPTLKGKAVFNCFVGQNNTGGTIQPPDGIVTFTFRKANLSFSSTGFDWLTTSGNTAFLKGSGKVNGVSGYGFLISASNKGSGQQDLIRMKIWKKATGSVLYDSQRGAAEPSRLHGGKNHLLTNTKTTMRRDGQVVVAPLILQV